MKTLIFIFLICALCYRTYNFQIIQPMENILSHAKNYTVTCYDNFQNETLSNYTITNKIFEVANINTTEKISDIKSFFYSIIDILTSQVNNIFVNFELLKSVIVRYIFSPIRNIFAYAHEIFENIRFIIYLSFVLTIILLLIFSISFFCYLVKKMILVGWIFKLIKYFLVLIIYLIRGSYENIKELFH
jgi:hypothetical protein